MNPSCSKMGYSFPLAQVTQYGREGNPIEGAAFYWKLPLTLLQPSQDRLFPKIFGIEAIFLDTQPHDTLCYTQDSGSLGHIATGLNKRV